MYGNEDWLYEEWCISDITDEDINNVHHDKLRKHE